MHMKINTPNGPRGSFGMPEEMKEAMEKRKMQQEERGNEGGVREIEDNMGFDAPSQPSKTPDNPEEEDEKEELATDHGPRETLKELGIEPTEKDFHDLIFRGYLEKTIEIATIPGTETKFTAKLKSLVSDEIDAIDELIGEDLDRRRITREGLDIRKSMWTLAFAVLELSGRPTAKTVLDKEGKPDKLETAKARRKVLASLNPFIVDQLIRKHAQMVTSYNAILLNPKSPVVKKS